MRVMESGRLLTPLIPRSFQTRSKLIPKPFDASYIVTLAFICSRLGQAVCTLHEALELADKLASSFSSERVTRRAHTATMIAPNYQG